MELRRRVRGPVDAIEPSAAFRQRLARLVRRDGYGAGRVWPQTLADAQLPAGHYDLVFARWVFLFLPDPAAHIRKLAAALAPGGRLAIEDYYRDTFVMLPTPPEWPAFLAADHAFFASQGGDASMASRLPQLMEAAGLDIEDITPVIKTGRPGSAVWRWITTYFLGVMDRLAAHRPFTPAQAGRLGDHWRRMAATRTAILVSPCVVDIVGRARRPRPKGTAKRTK
jgi:SAM-dependent methyltransferase